MHGLAMEELAALAPEDLEDAKGGIAGIRKREVELKQSGSWDGVDLPEHVAEVLREIDIYIFPPGSLPEPVSIEEG